MTDTIPASTALKAACLCGAVKFTVAVPESSLPLPAHLCHCSLCRRTHGILCSFHFELPSAPSFISPSSLNEMTAYDTSDRVRRYFCSTCGGHMLDWGLKDGGWFGSIGMFEKANGIFDLRKHVFTRSTKDGGLSQWVKGFGGHDIVVSTERGDEDEDLGTSMQTSALSPTGDSNDDLLHAHCQCGGVSFYISRPDNLTAGDPELKKWIAPNFSTKWRGSCCMCRSCRLSTGGTIVPFIFVPNIHITVPGANDKPVKMSDDMLIGTSKIYQSSKDVRRTFCGRCGAFVFYAADDRPKIVDIGAGLLDAPEGVLALDWIEWRSGRVSWLDDGVAYDAKMADGLVEGLKEWGTKEYGEPGSWLLG